MVRVDPCDGGFVAGEFFAQVFLKLSEFASDILVKLDSDETAYGHKR